MDSLIAYSTKKSVEEIKDLFRFRGAIRSSFILKLAGAGLIGLGVAYLAKIWRSYGFFKKRGIKTPPYTFLFGNVPEILEKDYSNILVEWTKTYGKTYGYFEGHLPILVTSDIELIDEIFYKKFSHFAARKRHPQQISDNGSDSNVFLASKNRWKRLRNISNQTFSPAKLKELLPAMKMCSNRLIDVILQNIDKEVNISELIDRMAMDIVWICMFGIDADLQRNYKFNYFVRVEEFLNNLANFDLPFMLTTYFYELKPLIVCSCALYTFFMSKLCSNWGNPFFWVMSQVHEIIEKRAIELQNQPNINKAKKHDLVQLLMEAESNEVNIDLDNQQYEAMHTTKIQKKMTRREILRSLVGFMIAGFGTTASTLGFSVHILLKYPEELEKLRDEIDSLNEITYETINQLEYLDMFIKEVLRMYPVVNSLQNRRCTQPITLKGIDFPENLLVAVDVISLHYDPENWPGVDPQVFYPMRFSHDANYNKLAYMPFGAGARICVGMRFAMLEIKLTLASILRNFDILPALNHPNKLTIRDGLFTIRKPKYGVYAVFKPRDQTNKP